MKNVTTNFLAPENCNKAKCKTCMFGPTPIQLSPERLQEIKNYLASGESSHVCHTTNKTCYGGLEFQARIFHSLTIIAEPTVDCLLETAAKFLSKAQ